MTDPQAAIEQRHREAAEIADNGAIATARALADRDCGASQSDMRAARKEYLAGLFANFEARLRASELGGINREHVWFKCEQPCEKQNCPYCDGGLAFCTVCRKGEAELADDCPGPEPVAGEPWGYGWYDHGGKKHAYGYLPTIHYPASENVSEGPFPLYAHPPTRGERAQLHKLREALEKVQKVRAGYNSQMKFCDIEPLGYFREFINRTDFVDAALREHLSASPSAESGADGGCQDCDRWNPVWHAPSPLWNLVMGGPDATDDPGGVVCPACFIKRAEAAGIVPHSWLISLPETQAGVGSQGSDQSAPSSIAEQGEGEKP